MNAKITNTLKLEFDSDSKNESFARSTVSNFAARLDPTITELSEIRTAVSEAVTNCIQLCPNKKFMAIAAQKVKLQLLSCFIQTDI